MADSAASYVRANFQTSTISAIGLTSSYVKRRWCRRRRRRRRRCSAIQLTEATNDARNREMRRPRGAIPDPFFGPVAAKAKDGSMMIQ